MVGRSGFGGVKSRKKKKRGEGRDGDGRGKKGGRKARIIIFSVRCIKKFRTRQNHPAYIRTKIGVDSFRCEACLPL